MLKTTKLVSENSYCEMLPQMLLSLHQVSIHNQTKKSKNKSGIFGTDLMVVLCNVASRNGESIGETVSQQSWLIIES